MCIQQSSFCPFKNMNGLLNLEMIDIIHKFGNFNTEIFCMYTRCIFGLSCKVSVNPFNKFHLILWLLSVDKMSSWQKDLAKVSLTWSNNNFLSLFFYFSTKTELLSLKTWMVYWTLKQFTLFLNLITSLKRRFLNVQNKSSWVVKKSEHSYIQTA